MYNLYKKKGVQQLKQQSFRAGKGKELNEGKK